MTAKHGLSEEGRSSVENALDVLENVIPYIPGEEEKVARETGKILGRVAASGIVPTAFPVSATCTRAAVSEGHTEAASGSLRAPAEPAHLAAALSEVGRGLGGRDLASA